MLPAALFGDGAAACVLRAGEAGIAEIEAAGEHTWPDTLDIMAGISIRRVSKRSSRKPSVFCRGQYRARGHGYSGTCENKNRRCGSLRLPSGRRKGGRGARDRVANRARIVGSRARRPSRIWQHVGSHRASVLDHTLRAGLPPRSVLMAMGPGFSASCVSLKRAA